VAAVAVDVEAGVVLAVAEEASVAGPLEAEADSQVGDFQAEVALAHRLAVAVK
jgi:hypothetical protein